MKNEKIEALKTLEAVAHTHTDILQKRNNNSNNLLALEEVILPYIKLKNKKKMEMLC